MVLLTGATGNVGRPLVWLLDEAGVSFRAFVRDPGRARAILGTGLGGEVAPGELAEPATLDAALRGTEVLFLLNGDPALEEGAIDAAVRAGCGA